ncbi:MBL fold metallo-hydrolase [candidate division KSB1 bacterium]|nr:MBL fold metallo-hydrolase [candidate division KSB1 bacterium]
MTTLKEFRPGLLLTEVSLDDFDVRGAVIIGDNYTVVWDSLSHPRDLQPVLPLLEQKYWVLVYTHADWDHAWGTAGLPYHDQPIIGHINCARRFDEEAPAELREKQKAQPGVWNEVVLVPPTLSIFEDEMELTLGNISVYLHHLPGHTLDCIVGFIPEWGILLAGDAVETPLPVINADSPIEKWIAGLQKWERNERVQYVIPAHGKIGGRELLRQNSDYLQNLLAGISPNIPEKLDDFYRETHRNNLRYANFRIG